MEPWLTRVSQHQKWRAHASVLSVNFAMTESCSPWTLFHFSGAIKEVVLVAVEVEQVGTITARLDLKSPPQRTRLASSITADVYVAL